MKSSLFSSDGRIVEKNDQTPVTVADFGVQALVSLGSYLKMLIVMTFCCCLYLLLIEILFLINENNFLWLPSSSSHEFGFVWIQEWEVSDHLSLKLKLKFVYCTMLVHLWAKWPELKFLHSAKSLHLQAPAIIQIHVDLYSWISYWLVVFMMEPFDAQLTNGIYLILQMLLRCIKKML